VPKSGQAWDPTFLLGHPLFEVFEPLARDLRGTTFPSAEQFTQLAESQRTARAPEAASLRFSHLERKPRRHKRTQLILHELYDGSIHLKRQVPCLSCSYHDLFNALSFSAFVHSKRVLHERQFRALEQWVGDLPQLPGKRTREQDALTIFDEGGVVLLMAEPFLSHWRASTEASPIPPFAPGSGVVPLLFGHALLEHLFEGHSQVRASAVVIELDAPLPSGATILDLADCYLAARLSDPSEFTQPGADGIFFMDQTEFSIGPPKPSWSAWHPGDREAFQSRYAQLDHRQV